MTEHKTRSIDLRAGTGTRTSVRLDDATWVAVDLIAERKGIKWGDWVRELLKQNPEASNATAVIRNATVNELMMATIIDDDGRGFGLASQESHQLMKCSGPLSNKQLDEILAASTVQGRSDFGGFEIAFGRDDIGRDCVWVINGMKQGMNFMFAASTGDKQ